MGRLYYGVKDYENAIRAFDYYTDWWWFLGAFMEDKNAWKKKLILAR
jgi:hypothetical protein